MAENNSSDITTLTVQLLSAFVSKNEVSSAGLADLIKTTRAALTEDLAAPLPAPEPEYTPAVSIRKSLSSPDHILSLIDGKPYKTLKRHLSANGLTEKEYRARYNLPASYPMVAPNYSQMRRAVAKDSGLGRKSSEANIAVPAQASPPASAIAALAPATAQKASPKPVAQKNSGKAQAKTAPGKAAAVKPERATSPAPRKKLSIFAAKDAAPTPSLDAKGEPAATSASSGAKAAKPKADKKAPSKANGSAKPKSLKSALKAAGAHLGKGTEKDDAESAKS